MLLMYAFSYESNYPFVTFLLSEIELANKKENISLQYTILVHTHARQLRIDLDLSQSLSSRISCVCPAISIEIQSCLQIVGCRYTFFIFRKTAHSQQQQQHIRLHIRLQVSFLNVVSNKLPINLQHNKESLMSNESDCFTDFMLHYGADNNYIRLVGLVNWSYLFQPKKFEVPMQLFSWLVP